jgi:A/G-specific adenine glycosylase
LPWRKTKDPYKILISEVMLQQTQVPRVIEKYKEFLKAFPTVQVLARQDLAEVLRVWSGMGYNRRAKFLKSAAEAIVKNYSGKVPRDLAALQSLPGIGSYTAAAIRAFAFNEAVILIETNIRATFIHTFFSADSVIPTKNKGRSLGKTDTKITDAELLPLIEKTAEGQDPREWYWALMDYGAHIKKTHKNPSRASASFVKQSKFEGSIRQVRGAILRELGARASSEKVLNGRLNLPFDKSPQVKPVEVGLQKRARGPLAPFGKEKIREALLGLERDGMIKRQGGKWGIV